MRKTDSIKYGTVFFIFIVIVIHICGHSFGQDSKFFLREDFETLDNWGPLYFPKIKKHSSYMIEQTESESYLKAESNSSASALIYKKKFNCYSFPSVRWQWRVDNIYAKGDATAKKGDDYPIRVYIIFKYDPKKAGFFEKMKYGTAKLFYGKYPPHSSLNYIWANKEHKERIITSPYTDKSKMIVLEQGPSKVGTWQKEEVNIIQDYRIAFGEKPPAVASIAIMNDSDNTGEKSVSFIDYLEIYHR